MDANDAARANPSGVVAQTADHHPASLRFDQRLLDAGCRQYRTRTRRVATAAEPTSTTWRTA